MVVSKAVISNRIYLPKTEKLFNKVFEELTYIIPSTRRNQPPEVFNDVTIVSPRVFSIPCGRMDLVPKDLEIVDKRILNYGRLPEPKTPLREDQSEIIDLIEDSSLINAKPGWGKTFSALYLAKKLGQKTLIVVHNTVLRDQWVKEINDLFGIKAGIIGTGKFETDAPIVVSNIQTLVSHTHTYSKMFGTLICDEVHRVPSTTFKKIVDTSYARYKIGLSATIKRKDNKHVYIPDYFSLDRYTPLTDTAMKPKILILYTDFRLNNKLGHWVKKVTELLSNPEYRKFVTDVTDIKSNVEGHKVLTVSDRLEFLEDCATNTPNSALVTSYVTNRMEIFNDVIEDRLNSIYGTTSIFKEGVNIPPLSCLILGAPINNDPLLEQIVGRVTRPYPGKKQPEIIDIALKDPVSRRQLAQRINFYISEGYEIIEHNND